MYQRIKQTTSMMGLCFLCCISSLIQVNKANGIDRPTDVGKLTAEFIEGINKGFMMSLMPDGGASPTSECLVTTDDTNAQITKLFDFKSYETNGVNDFQNGLQIVLIKLNTQWEKCKFNELLIGFDRALSEWGALSGSISSLSVQIPLGWQQHDTAFWKGFDTLYGAWFKNDWKQFGDGANLILSQIIHYEAPEVVQNIVPIG